MNILNMILAFGFIFWADCTPVAPKTPICGSVPHKTGAVTSSNVARLKARFGLAFPKLEALHEQWDKADREWKCPKINVHQTAPKKPGKDKTPGEYKLTDEQKNWFSSLGNEKVKSTVTKRGIRFRREYRQLSCLERERFHWALWKMKTTMIGNMSQYDIFVGFHHPRNSPFAHGGAAFLPWHREYLWRFEIVLQSHDSRVNLPYWDSTLDRYLPDPEHSILWTDKFLGTGSGVVNTGPFSNWTASNDCVVFGSRLTRNVGAIISLALFSDEDLEDVFNKTTYQELVVPPVFEFEHGGVHVWVGGHMGQLTCSPTDPIFWMHHAFVDYIWETFRIESQRTVPHIEYPAHDPPEVDIGGLGHNPEAPMDPFEGKRNIHGMSQFYTRYFYSYMPHPEKCSTHRQCGRYLFCHQGFCMSKVKVNGNCTGLVEEYAFDKSSMCECGSCVKRPGSVNDYYCKPSPFPFLCQLPCLF